MALHVTRGGAIKTTPISTKTRELSKIDQIWIETMNTRGKKKGQDMPPEDVVPEGELFVISTKPSEVPEEEDNEPEAEDSQGPGLKM